MQLMHHAAFLRLVLEREVVEHLCRTGLTDGQAEELEQSLARQRALNARAEELEAAGMRPGAPGIARVTREPQGYRERMGLTSARLANATHLVWATGGGMVPETEMRAYLERGRSLLD